jgi:hypothetical protein
MMRGLSLLALGCALALTLAAPARGQRPFAGVGAGLSFIHDRGTEEDGVRPGVRALVGWRVFRGVSLLLEGTAHGLGENPPDSIVRESGVLSVYTIFLAAQVDLADEVYLRPALGVGGNAFAVGIPLPGGGFATDISREGGPALGLTAGYAVRVSDGFSVNVEGVGAWSGGEDSSGSRVVAGLLVVPTWRL